MSMRSHGQEDIHTDDGEVALLCLGEALVEFNHAADGDIIQGFGGDTSNCAIAAARQGARVGYLSAVGKDAHGDLLMALWAREGVDARHVRRSKAHPTGYYRVNHASGGHEFSYFRQGSAAAHMTPGDLPMPSIASARVLHVSGISQAISESARDTVTAAIAHARASGVTVSYDTNLRLKLWSLDEARSTIHAALARCDIVLPGHDDAVLLCGESEPERIVDFYLGLGPGTVALTLGPRGCLLGLRDESGGSRQYHVPGIEVDAVDATAAGDTFDGAFLAMLLAGAQPEQAARHANVAAALSTLGYGAVAPMPDLEQVLRWRPQPGP